MTIQEINSKLAEGENQHIEFKTTLRDPALLAKLISAFANKDGGTIFIGVEEPVRIIGCNSDSVIKIYKRALELLNPTPKTNLEFYDFEGKALGVITVESAHDIVFSNGSLYSRVGSETQAMSASQIKDKLAYNPQENLDSVIKPLAEAIEKQTKTIDELREEIKNSSSLKNKLKDYFVGGIIGAILGLLATMATT